MEWKLFERGNKLSFITRNESGIIKKCDVLITFEHEQNTYLVYTENETNEDGERICYSAKIATDMYEDNLAKAASGEDEAFKMQTIESEEEWKLVENSMEEARRRVNEEKNKGISLDPEDCLLIIEDEFAEGPRVCEMECAFQTQDKAYIFYRDVEMSSKGFFFPYVGKVDPDVFERCIYQDASERGVLHLEPVNEKNDWKLIVAFFEEMKDVLKKKARKKGDDRQWLA